MNTIIRPDRRPDRHPGGRHLKTSGAARFPRLRDASFFLSPAGPVFLVLAFFFLSVTAVFAAADPGAGYQRARSAMDRLSTDAKRGMQREPWLRLSEEFLDIYKANPRWNNAPAALYRSGLALDELARRSALDKDAAAAVRRYLQVPDAHPGSVLADDALLRAAKLRLERLNDPAGAAELLDRLLRDFSKGDMAGAARTLRAGLSAAANAAASASPASPDPGGKARFAATGAASATPARLTQVDWQSRRNLARVTVHLDRPVSWSVRALEADPQTGAPARLVLDLPGTQPDAGIKPGARVSASLLTRLRVDLGAPGVTRLLLDFSGLKRFTVTETESPCTLVLTASSTDAALPGGKRPGAELRSALDPDRVQVPADIAAQLGLSLKTVVIDAGHGGSDPGTRHNGVIEKDVALDIALRLGEILEKQGLRVRFTRRDDVKLPLEARTRFANETGGDAFVSIHVNAHPSNDAMSGLETYFLDFASSSSAARLAGVENALSDRHLGDLEGLLADLMLGARTQESRRLAESVQSATLLAARKEGFALRDGGVRSAPFHVLLGSTMPGVLVEAGYCTDKQEAGRLSRPAYRAALAEGIARGLLAYSGLLGK